MTEPAKRYWFPAKRYGWGWGPPCTWQGWAVLTVWGAVLFVNLRLVRAHTVRSALFTAGMIGVLVTVCYAKGEPPRWRWGERDDERPRDERPPRTARQDESADR